jgi:hypothetical protein
MIQIQESFYSGLKQCFFGGGGGGRDFHTTTAKENPVQSVRGGFLEKMCKSRHIFLNVFLDIAKTKRDP